MSLERPAHREPEGCFRLKVIQPARIVLNEIDLRHDLIVENNRIKSSPQEINFALFNERLLRHDFLVQTVDVICVVDAERRLHDGQTHDEFDTGRATQTEIGAMLDWQAGGEIRRRERAYQAQWN